MMYWPGRRKLAGILLEAEAVAGSRLAVVVGIGTNVVAAPEGTPTPATSLAALGVRISAEELFAELSDAWAELRGIWDNGRGLWRNPGALAWARGRAWRESCDPGRRRHPGGDIRYA